MSTGGLLVEAGEMLEHRRGCCPFEEMASVRLGLGFVAGSDHALETGTEQV